MNKNKIYNLSLIISIVIAFICIKLIDNLPYIINIFESFLNILYPFIIAFIIAYILNPLMIIFEKRFNLKRATSLILTYAIILGVLITFVWFLIPKIIDNIIDLSRNVPAYAKQFKIWAEELSTTLQERFNVDIGNLIGTNADTVISSIQTAVKSSLETILGQVISTTNTVVKFVFGFIISIYILSDKDKLLSHSKKLAFCLFKESTVNKISEFIKITHTMVGTYIGTKAIDSSIIAGLALLGFIIIKSPYALLLACIVGCTNMIPYFGPFIGMIPAFIINVLYNPFKGLQVLIFLFILQQFDGWFLDPKLIGNKVGLNPFFVILAVTIGGSLFGVAGMLLGVPAMAVFKTYYLKFINKRSECSQ